MGESPSFDPLARNRRPTYVLGAGEDPAEKETLMAARKTFDVASLLAEANRLMALPDNEVVDANFRKGVATMIEGVLHASGNYKGFEWNEWAATGYAAWVADGSTLPVDEKYFGDKTRKTYFGAAPKDKSVRTFPAKLAA
jgi:hypothetical protein